LRFIAVAVPVAILAFVVAVFVVAVFVVAAVMGCLLVVR
jgi:hypothetical protein